MCLGIGSDELRRKPCLGRRHRQQRGSGGNRGVIAAGDVRRIVADRRRQRIMQRMDQLPVRIPGKLEGEVGRRLEGRLHGRHID
ncbi:MAG TPA: hypothetical protein VFL55_02040 [Acetobacteraceae bacterium]|nr:hypothetical protein [Acetobacteraceae bacterium]